MPYNNTTDDEFSQASLQEIEDVCANVAKKPKKSRDGRMSTSWLRSNVEASMNLDDLLREIEEERDNKSADCDDSSCSLSLKEIEWEGIGSNLKSENFPSSSSLGSTILPENFPSSISSMGVVNFSPHTMKIMKESIERSTTRGSLNPIPEGSTQ